jgi:predicted PurR-regulated permease PerM
MKEPAAKSNGPPRGRALGERARTVCLLVIAVVVVGFALKQLGAILTPLLVALFLFFLIKPLGDAVVARRVPRWVAYPLLFVLAGLLILLFGTVVYTNVAGFLDRLKEYQGKIKGWADALARLVGQANAEGQFAWEQRYVADLFEWSRQFFGVALGTTLGLLESSVMVIFYLFFIFLEVEKLPKRVRRAYPPESAEKVLEIGRNINDGIKRYLVAKTVVSVGLAATTATLGYLFDLDFWLLWGAFMFLANYITYVGSMAALVPPVALAFLQFRSPAAAAVLTALLVANRFLWIDFVEMRYLGRHLNISPLLLLLALAGFYWMWGVVGMVLAVPLVTAAKIVLFNFEKSKPLAILLSEE